jgi:hypothetical protein
VYPVSPAPSRTATSTAFRLVRAPAPAGGSGVRRPPGRAHAELDHAEYPKGIKISDRQIRELESRAITRHDWHGEWNYTLTAAPLEP